MNERRKPYPFDQIELKWQAAWDKNRSFHAPNPGEESFDRLDAYLKTVTSKQHEQKGKKHGSGKQVQ